MIILAPEGIPAKYYQPDSNGSKDGDNDDPDHRIINILLNPLYNKGSRQLYSAAADELLVGAGKNVGVNIFDQSRIFLLLGYKFSKRFTVEGGYLNQTLQQGRRINNTIIQRNNGIVLTSLLTF